MKTTGRTIVVGVDGSRGAEQAIRWAAETAVRRGSGLRLVHAQPIVETYFYDGVLAATGADSAAVRAEGERVVRAAVELARWAAPDLVITTEIRSDPPSLVLIEQSRDALMVVVGRTGHGGFTGMLVGSTAAAVLSHAHCPVAVVRGRDDTTTVAVAGPVVVGIDGSPASEQAIAVAFEEASQRGAPLVAAHVWMDVTRDEMYALARFVTGWESARGEEERLLAQRLAGWQEKYPDVEVRRELVRDHPRHALLELSATAQLVVVGSRGRGGFTGLLLGSTSQALALHAQCPVLVVRSEG
jgi:nucleotide-binding universal stress UspA family protein